MSIRCPALQDEYIGSDAGAICRKQIMKQKGLECPRARNRYTKIQDSCFHIETLVRDGRKNVTVEEARKILLPDDNEVAGTGEPTAKKPE